MKAGNPVPFPALQRRWMAARTGRTPLDPLAAALCALFSAIRVT